MQTAKAKSKSMKRVFHVAFPPEVNVPPFTLEVPDLIDQDTKFVIKPTPHAVVTYHQYDTAPLTRVWNTPRSCHEFWRDGEGLRVELTRLPETWTRDGHVAPIARPTGNRDRLTIPVTFSGNSRAHFDFFPRVATDGTCTLPIFWGWPFVSHSIDENGPLVRLNIRDLYASIERAQHKRPLEWCCAAEFTPKSSLYKFRHHPLSEMDNLTRLIFQLADKTEGLK